MATSPPFPPPPPYGFDPRQQRFAQSQMREQVRAHARAQKLAFRAQRDLYRQQTRALRRTSILGPLLIVAIGVVLLLVRLGRLPFTTFATWYGRWWPLLLVTAGVILALEWAFDSWSAQSHPPGTPLPRRSFGFGVVFLLFLLAVAGGVMNHVRDGRDLLINGFSINPDNVGEFVGESHQYTQELDQPFPAGTALTIENPHGDVTVTGKSDDNQIHIVVNKQIYSWFDTSNSSRADQLSPRVNLAGTTLSIVMPALDAASSDLSVTIPDGLHLANTGAAQITITANHGSVTVSSLEAPVNVTANHGDVALDHLTGPSDIHMSHSGSSVSAHTIQGDVSLHGHADDLNITDVSGHTTLEGEFYGDTHLEHLAGPVSFRTGRTQFSFAKLDGMVDISPDEELTGSKLTGPTELRTRSRNISFEQMNGPVDITNSNGTVDVTGSAPVGNISIENVKGAVNVTIPDRLGLTVFAQTKDGAIESDLNLPTVPSNNQSVMSGTLGDGLIHLNLHTTHADINLHKGLPTPPQPPPPPGLPKPAKPTKIS